MNKIQSFYICSGCVTQKEKVATFSNDSPNTHLSFPLFSEL